jgi:hypothetical protein
MRSSIQYNYAITTLLLCFNPQAFLNLTIEALFVSMKVPQYPLMSRLFAIQLVECMLFRSHHPSCGRNAYPLPDWLARVLDRGSHVLRSIIRDKLQQSFMLSIFSKLLTIKPRYSSRISLWSLTAMTG